MTKKIVTMSLLCLFAVSAVAFAHAGEVHTYMGTITVVHDDGSFMMKKTDGETIHVVIAKSTKLLAANGTAVKRARLEPRTRVVVKMSKDGKTALSVRMSAPPKKK